MLSVKYSTKLLTYWIVWIVDSNSGMREHQRSGTSMIEESSLSYFLFQGFYFRLEDSLNRIYDKLNLQWYQKKINLIIDMIWSSYLRADGNKDVLFCSSFLKLWFSLIIFLLYIPKSAIKIYLWYLKLGILRSDLLVILWHIYYEMIIIYSFTSLPKMKSSK